MDLPCIDSRQGLVHVVAKDLAVSAVRRENLQQAVSVDVVRREVVRIATLVECRLADEPFGQLSPVGLKDVEEGRRRVFLSGAEDDFVPAVPVQVHHFDRQAHPRARLREIVCQQVGLPHPIVIPKQVQPAVGAPGGQDLVLPIAVGVPDLDIPTRVALVHPGDDLALPPRRERADIVDPLCIRTARRTGTEEPHAEEE